MSDRYLLPCECGTASVVDRRQAGETITCSCGRAVEVPTLRGLAQLEQVPASEEVRSEWGPRQGMIFVGLVIAVIGLGLALYLYLSRPTFNLALLDMAVERLSPTQSLALWTLVSQGIDLGPTQDSVMYQRAAAAAWRWIYVALAIGIAGALLAASSLLIEPPRSKQD